MRVAILADIHGNLAALEAALAALDTLRPDRVIVAGDVVNGAPDSAACWEQVKSLRCPILRGNHERYVFDFGSPRAHVDWSTPQFGPLHFTISQLSETQRNEMSLLPIAWRDPDLPDLLVVHASLRSDQDQLHPYTPEDTLDGMFGGAVEPLIVRAHNHLCAVRHWRGRDIVTAGSVGLTLDGNPSAQFVVIERRTRRWSIRHHAVRYDVEATLRRFRETNYIEQTGPIGWLFQREVATATHQIVPFLRFYERARRALPTLDLDEALQKFLGGSV